MTAPKPRDQLRSSLCADGCGATVHWPQRALDGHPLGWCRECSAPMLGDTVWHRTPPEQRAEFSRHNGHGLCNRCYKRAQRATTAKRTRSPQLRAEDVLEEWVLLRSDGVTDLEVAAKRIGMTRAGLEQALYRARRRGDRRGEIYRNDQLGTGALVGTTRQRETTYIGRAA